MKRFIKLAAWILYYILIVILLVSLVIGQLKIQKKVKQLDSNIEVLSEWYVELKNENIDLTVENFNIYTQIVNNKKSLNKTINNITEGFKVVNKQLDNIKLQSLDVKNKIEEIAKENNEDREVVDEVINRIEKNKQELKETLKYPSYNYLKSVTVYIRGTSLNKGWAGTGIIVKSRTFNTYILTNAHIVGKGRENVTLYIEDGYKTKLATVVKIHDKLDLALIKINERLKGKQPIRGISIRTKPQDKVYLVGHHLGRKYVYGEGVFAGYEGANDIIQIPVLFGNSGSGVFDKNGKLVSLIFAINQIGLVDVDCAHGLGIDSLNIWLFLKTAGVYNGL